MLQRVINKLLRMFIRARGNRLKKYYSQIFSFSKTVLPYTIENVLFSQKKLVEERLIYKDDTWNSIRAIDLLFLLRKLSFRMDISDNICYNNKIRVQDDDILIKSTGLKDDWIYWIFPDNLVNDYLIEFNTIVNTTFTEFQFAFKHASIQERYRFMVVDNAKLVFEVVNKGYFASDLKTVPFHFVLGEKYSIKIVVKKNFYSFIVNDNTIMTIHDKKRILMSGGFAFIFWHVTEKQSDIDLKLTDLVLYSIC